MVSGILGIIMAYLGFGVWALVIQTISNQLLITVILWFTVHWRPRFIFDFKRVKILFSYGWKLLVSSLIDALYNEANSLIIGKLYNPSVLGFYTRGKQFPSLIVTNINGSIQSVMLPALASQQIIGKKRYGICSILVHFVFPLNVGLAAVAEPLVKLLLTEVLFITSSSILQILFKL